MKRIISLGCSCVMALGFSAMAFAGSGPETMNLKEVFEVEGKKRAVILPHHKHQAKVPCAGCHLNPRGGGSMKVEFVKKKGISNDFHKKLCWPCHVEMKVPKGKSCSTCHNAPE